MNQKDVEDVMLYAEARGLTVTEIAVPLSELLDYQNKTSIRERLVLVSGEPVVTGFDPEAFTTDLNEQTTENAYEKRPAYVTLRGYKK